MDKAERTGGLGLQGDALRIGVDIGGNDIKFGATNITADPLLPDQLVKRPSLTADGPQKTAEQIIDGVAAVLEKLRSDWAMVLDVSVTVPCPCSAEGVILDVTNLGASETKHLWKVAFGDILGERLNEVAGRDIPVFACNDANAAGQDDDFTRYGHDDSPRTSIFITTGTGLGGCVLINGTVFFGAGQAGELGHVKAAIPEQYAERFAADEYPPCGCGARQCVEARASLTALTRRVQWALSDTGLAVVERQLAARRESLDANVVRQLRKYLTESPRKAAYQVRTYADGHGDALCRWLLEDWAIMIGALFASVAPVVHPNLCVIGGGMTEVSEAMKDWFIAIVRRVFDEVNQQACFNRASNKNEIVWSVSQDQGWRGAILMAMRAHGV